MNIEAFLLCDAATGQQGKLNVLGAFNTISAKKLPVVHSGSTIAARIRFEISEEGKHSAEIRIIDEDAKPVGHKLEGNINVKVRDCMDSETVNLVLSIRGLKLEKYGQHKVNLVIDGKTKASLPLWIREVSEDK